MARGKKQRQRRRVSQHWFCLSVACLLFLNYAPVFAQRQVSSRQPLENTNSTAGESDANLSVEARAALDAAVAALQQNALPEAERDARRTIAVAPRSAVAHNLLGVILDRAGRTDNALAEFNTARSEERRVGKECRSWGEAY